MMKFDVREDPAAMAAEVTDDEIPQLAERLKKAPWARSSEDDAAYRQRCHKALDHILTWDERRRMHKALDRVLTELDRRRCAGGGEFQRRRL
jgi:IS5 family transposase